MATNTQRQSAKRLSQVLFPKAYRNEQQEACFVLPLIDKRVDEILLVLYVLSLFQTLCVPISKSKAHLRLGKFIMLMRAQRSASSSFSCFQSPLLTSNADGSLVNPPREEPTVLKSSATFLIPQVSLPLSCAIPFKKTNHTAKTPFMPLAS